LRRRRRKDRAPFLGARPVPKRLAGYEPAPREPGRVPEEEVPLIPSEPTPVYPPKTDEWAPPYIPPFEIPGIVVPPIAPPPPCNPKTDPECPPPKPPPPDDVPEPGVLFLLLFGLAAIRFVFRKTPSDQIG